MGRVNRVPAALKVTAAAVVMGTAALLAPSGQSTAGAAAAEKGVDYAKDVQPVFAQSCVKCHGAPDPRDPRKKPAGGLRLDNKEEALKGGKSGKAIEPGKSADSLLYKVLQGPTKNADHEIAGMPKAMRGQQFKPLPAAKVELIKKWIDQGAK